MNAEKIGRRYRWYVESAVNAGYPSAGAEEMAGNMARLFALASGGGDVEVWAAGDAVSRHEAVLRRELELQVRRTRGFDRRKGVVIWREAEKAVVLERVLSGEPVNREDVWKWDQWSKVGEALRALAIEGGERVIKSEHLGRREEWRSELEGMFERDFRLLEEVLEGAGEVLDRREKAVVKDLMGRCFIIWLDKFGWTLDAKGEGGRNDAAKGRVLTC